MSLIPMLFNDNWTRPSRILDQHFGMGLDFDDLLSPIHYDVMRLPSGYIRPWRTAAGRGDEGSTIQATKDKFQINLDVQQFKPSEIQVRVSGNNSIIVEAKHEEKQDEHGFVSRQFVRRYVLPEGHDINNVVSSLSSDGVLSIAAPRISAENEKNRSIPIQQTGQPSKPVEAKKEGQEKK